MGKNKKLQGLLSRPLGTVETNGEVVLRTGVPLSWGEGMWFRVTEAVRINERFEEEDCYVAEVLDAEESYVDKWEIFQRNHKGLRGALQWLMRIEEEATGEVEE